jgi:uncharacterized protein (TIGR00369 family)
MSLTQDIPDGFEPHDRKSPPTDAWEPLYARIEDQRLILGLRLGEAHTNSRGFAHGGLLATLADNTMGLNCARRFQPARGLVTVNLALSYQGVAKVGQWLSFEPDHVKTGKNLCFAELSVLADGSLCARAGATFAVNG